MRRRSRTRVRASSVCGSTIAAAAALVLLTPVAASARVPSPAASRPGLCRPAAAALSYSDALDKADYAGATVGGLSDLARDPRGGGWVATVDNHADDPSRLYSFRDLTRPRISRAPLVLRKPDGTAFTGQTADFEGLAVLPDGDYLVSSETEPSLRVFGRDGVQKSALPVPARFAVTGRTPQGEATANATLEGLAISPSGHTIVAAMEGALSGDTTPADTTAHRLLTYRADGRGGWLLAKQVAYRTHGSNRIADVALYDDDTAVVLEAAFDPTRGNSVELYTARALRGAVDVSPVPDLAAAPARDFAPNSLLADLVTCPTLGAPSRETQANPLLDNYEGLAFTARGPRVGGRALVGLSLISDDNFSPTQYTRVLNLAAALPLR